MLVVMVALSYPAVAAPDEASAKARAEALSKSTEKPPDIVIVDDVGVGDHFPSQVPGSAPYRLPPRDDLPPPPPQKEPAPAVEEPVSDPGEWATIGAPPQPAPAVAPGPAPAPSAVAQPVAAPAVPAAASPAQISSDLERETLQRASNSLLQGNCESELPRLAELLERTDNSGIKARVRILRARCFSQRSKPERAKAEYLVYLREFPEGVYADEARDAASVPQR